METTAQSWWVVDGNFRVLCSTQQETKDWVAIIIQKGGVPEVKAVQ